ncbi:thioredoxin reductase 2, mitochondrial [Cloeon dipterum]|uniref:thioredoxin reductase 2, mitochondrial n=1 Tax=Cloeon dipterum TaxID=197152 RepID=UPI0032209526
MSVLKICTKSFAASLGRQSERSVKKIYRISSSFRTFSTEGKLEYDLVVIGGGSGGLACAKEAVAQGARVAVLDYVQPSPRSTKWGLGGTCVNVGCIPKKLMHHASLLGEAIEDARSFGWRIPGNAEIDWLAMRDAVQDHIKSVNWVTRVSLRDNKIEYVNGRGRLADANTVVATLHNMKEVLLKTKNVVVAVGARPKYSTAIGAQELGISSDDIFSLEKPPGKTLVVGGGYIGLECAGFLNGFGYPSTVMLRSVPLRGFDQQMASMVVNEMEGRGVNFICKCVPESLSKTPDRRILVKWNTTPGANGGSGQGEDVFDTVLFAVGRKAVTDSLALEKAGVETHKETGKIFTTNEQTNVPNIFAVGDVLHRKPELTPVAVQAGRLLARRMFGNDKTLMDYDNVATTVFTPLEYGFVGLSEEESEKRHGPENLEVYHAFYKPTEFPIPQKDMSNCYIKVICLRREPRTVLGMHFVGPNAGEVIQGFSAAMKCRITMEQLLDTIGIHPTVAEEFTRLTITKRSGMDPNPQACCS